MCTSPRCGAKTRKGTPCMAPAIRGRKRCRKHGGATGSGAPKGNKNAYKHGMYTAKALEEAKELRKLFRSMKNNLEELN